MFYDLLKNENAFLQYKNKKLKKGLFHGFGPKLTFFPTFYFRKNEPGKCVVQYSRNRKKISRQ